MGWDWFNNPNKKEDKPIVKTEVKNYSRISINKYLVKKEILEDPSVLFKVVGSESNCMCGGTCGGCEYDDVLFIDLIVREKSLNEKDFLELLEKVDLDMFRLCKYVPFSISVLQKYTNRVDWGSISGDGYKYNKNKDFINNFHDKINWNKLGWSDLSDLKNYSDVEEIVFTNKYVPINIAIKNRILTLDHIKNHVDIVASYCDKLLDEYNYGVKLIEELDKDIIEPHLINHVEKYTKKCIEDSFVTKKYVSIIQLSNNIIFGEWSEFIINCKPDEQFILDNVVNKGCEHISRNTWDAISKHCNLSNKFIREKTKYLNWNILITKSKCDLSLIEERINDLDSITISKFQKLTPEFIDMCAEKYPEKLDWYYLCEFQELPEWLMRKNINMLNWGQVSWYQEMSKEFLEEFDKMINKTKLVSNEKMRMKKKGRFIVISDIKNL